MMILMMMVMPTTCHGHRRNFFVVFGTSYILHGLRPLTASVYVLLPFFVEIFKIVGFSSISILNQIKSG